MTYHLGRLREPDSRPFVEVLALDDKVDHIGILVVVPAGKVLAVLAPCARPRVFPLSAAVVQIAVGVVANRLLDLVVEV